jgi:hypothetical protein
MGMSQQDKKKRVTMLGKLTDIYPTDPIRPRIIIPRGGNFYIYKNVDKTSAFSTA